MSCLAVSAVEACDSSWKKRGLIQSGEHMRGGQHDLSSVLLGSSTQHNIVAATQIISSNSECSDCKLIHRSKTANSHCLVFKNPYHSGTVCSIHITITSPRAQSWTDFDIWSHWKCWCFLTVEIGVCADKSTAKRGWFSPFLCLSVSFSFSFLPTSQVWWLSAIMPVSVSPAAVEQSAGRPVRLPMPPCCELCSGGGTERESGELLIPGTIGHLNPRQAPYLHWAKALPESYDRAGRMITPRLTARDP